MSDDAEGTASEPPTIQQYRSAYDQANKFAKEVELFRSAVVIPAHNELRNAGYHFLRSVSDSGQVVNHKELGKAIGHCDRSMYETSEAGIFHALKIIDKFNDTYEGLVIPEYVDDWENILLTASEARDAITAGRKREGAVATATVYMEHFRKLKDICRKLDVSRGTLAAVAKRETRSFWLRIVIPAATLGSAVIIAATALFREELRCWLIG